MHACTKIERLKNGESFYTAELDAIAAARHSINLEAYIFEEGTIGSRFVEALAERRAGLKVKVVIDAIGASSRTTALSSRCAMPAGESSGISRCGGTPSSDGTTAPIAS